GGIDRRLSVLGQDRTRALPMWGGELSRRDQFKGEEMKLLSVILLAAVTAAQTPALEQQISDRITAGALQAAVSFLASAALQGRGTPSQGLEVAGEYIASQFRRAGLEPAGGDGYFQNAPYHLVTPNTEGFQLTLTTGGKEIRAEADAAYFN